jgi:hypothetical protein
MAAVGAVGAIVGVLVGVTALVDWIGKATSDPPPRQIDARIVSAETQEYSVSLAQYLRGNGRPTGGLTEREAREKGLIFSVRVRLRGNLGHEIPLRWWMFERDGDPLRGDIYSQTAGKFKPEAQDHSRTVELWIPYPPRAGDYVVRFTLLDDQGQPYDIENVPVDAPSIPAL